MGKKNDRPAKDGHNEEKLVANSIIRTGQGGAL